MSEWDTAGDSTMSTEFVESRVLDGRSQKPEGLPDPRADFCGGPPRPLEDFLLEPLERVGAGARNAWSCEEEVAWPRPLPE